MTECITLRHLEENADSVKAACVKKRRQQTIQHTSDNIASINEIIGLNADKLINGYTITYRYSPDYSTEVWEETGKKFKKAGFLVNFTQATATITIKPLPKMRYDEV